MKVKVLYFAAVRDLVGRDEEELDVPDDARTVAAFGAFLERAHPPLAGRMKHVRIAKNEAFAADGEPIAEGDTLALIPPVAGG
jgi:molybdopterin converting factor subunit 1